MEERFVTRYTVMASPIGELLLRSDEVGLTGLFMQAHRYGPESREGWIRDDGDPVLAAARTQLGEYFEGRRSEFALPLNLVGTPFQKRVWEALLEIPYGQTMSYGELAKRIGNPAASRAVGLANGHNPVSIIVPCHRVIGANRSLTGYGGGLERKKFLLGLERKEASLFGLASMQTADFAGT